MTVFIAIALARPRRMAGQGDVLSISLRLLRSLDGAVSLVHFVRQVGIEEPDNFSGKAPDVLGVANHQRYNEPRPCAASVARPRDLSPPLEHLEYAGGAVVRHFEELALDEF
jgi:hypothetical protein